MNNKVSPTLCVLSNHSMGEAAFKKHIVSAPALCLPISVFALILYNNRTFQF